ncbi:MAG TPA: monovalent cation/H(+) antiporter subunit G [Candidatus Aminicenantes bacterium]|nr:monovalent cation/H(+) antiporter subunit G [Candidatus Aminicenantes bacterium]
MGISSIIAIFLISLGTFFMAVGSVGLIRLPDFYCRAHAQGKVDTLALILIILGLMVYEGFTLNSVKLLLIVAFVVLTNPTGTNALTNAAYRFGLRPWFKRDQRKHKKPAGRG